MKNFILRKWEILKEESSRNSNSVLKVFLNKLFRKVVFAPLHLLDVFFAYLTFPIIAIYVLLKNKATKEKKIFFIGLEHVINKTAERGIGYLEKGYQPIMFSFEWTGMKHSLPFKTEIFKYNSSITIDNIKFAQALINLKPCCIEVYFEGDAYRQYFGVKLSKLFRTKVISIERGVWHGFKEHRVSYLTAKRYVSILKSSDKVFYRELGLFEIYDKYGLPRSKFYFDYNRVKVWKEPDFSKKNRNVLFLNGFKSFRRLDLLIKAIPLVKTKFPDVEFSIIGARSPEDIDYVKRELDALNIKGDVEIGFWDPDPRRFYDRASVFVLPATLVFCNFSLIEAMERGIHPVVTNVEDADKIIDHNIDGILCDMDENSIAHSIIEMLNDEDKRVEMGRNARKKIIEKFNSEKRLSPIIDLIEDRDKR
ncbi:MAG: glycosyltransferase family 4 protein [Cytophagaceae bacterium]